MKYEYFAIECNATHVIATSGLLRNPLLFRACNEVDNRIVPDVCLSDEQNIYSGRACWLRAPSASHWMERTIRKSTDLEDKILIH